MPDSRGPVTQPKRIAFECGEYDMGLTIANGRPILVVQRKKEGRRSKTECKASGIARGGGRRTFQQSHPVYVTLTDEAVTNLRDWLFAWELESA